MDARQLLGIRVKDIRTQLGLSQEELAFRCGMHASHIGFLERGQRNPSLDTLERLSLGLGVSLTALFDYENEPSTAVYDETTNKISIAPCSVAYYRLPDELSSIIKLIYPK